MKKTSFCVALEDDVVVSIQNAKIEKSNQRDKIRSDKIINGDRFHEGDHIFTSSHQQNRSITQLHISEYVYASLSSVMITKACE